jgi:hypothetical protein
MISQYNWMHCEDSEHLNYLEWQNTEAMLGTSKEIGLEVNPGTTKYMLMSRF